jgi:flagellar hook-basal body complex protein FliE
MEKFSEWVKRRSKKPKRDACYHKVKSRMAVWPSAYGSGLLVQCRKKGAKNWGNRRKKNEDTNIMSFSEYLNEMLGDVNQYDNAEHAYNALEEMQLDVENASFEDIKNNLIKLELYPQHGDGWHTFITRIKSVAKETTTRDDFKFEPELYESTFKLEKERGLRGWFDRNKGKGWIDCKASKKGHLVPCGRKKAGKGADREYPACRPTLGACNKSKHKKKSSERIDWKTKKSS